MEITPGRSYGFFTDTSVCIGCKACEVACKTWNELPGPEPTFGDGYDNTGEARRRRTGATCSSIDNVKDDTLEAGMGTAWLMMSDVCKHCKNASCMEVCPTGALMRTEFDTVYVQPDVCNGCRNCTSACPYHVIQMDETNKVAQKCTLCYDRLQGSLEPACAKTCPTDSINFGPVDELREMAKQRVETLHSQGVTQAYLYGADDSIYGGLNAFFLLMDKPEVYKLPNKEKLGTAQPQRRRRLPGLLRCRRGRHLRRGDGAAAASSAARRACDSGRACDSVSGRGSGRTSGSDRTSGTHDDRRRR